MQVFVCLSIVVGGQSTSTQVRRVGWWASVEALKSEKE